MRLFVDHDTVDFIIDDGGNKFSIGDIITVELLEKAVLDTMTLRAGKTIPVIFFRVLITESSDIRQYEACIRVHSKKLWNIMLTELGVGKPAILVTARYSMLNCNWTSFTVNGKDAFSEVRV